MTGVGGPENGARSTSNTRRESAMNALDHGMLILFHETPLAPKRAILSEA
jgi:hypothetical protein